MGITPTVTDSSLIIKYRKQLKVEEEKISRRNLQKKVNDY